ncbi:uncharacterized protein LOC142325474 [Lycorma delicatula]|uniref:uncharacterized protein LOC142325474 n=1 Tax=Lycorma delicatula TaxID=130591 RepID=UPI003F517DA3
MRDIIFPVVLLVNIINSVIALRPGESCNSEFGEALCTPITQCKLLPRIKLMGKVPEMCGFDSSGPIVCCPRYSHNLQIQKTNYQEPREPQIGRPDINFDHNIQSDWPVDNDHDLNYYNYDKTEVNKPKHNNKKLKQQLQSWDKNDEFTVPSTSSWTNTGRRKSTHDKSFDIPEVSTSRFPNFNDKNFKPQRPSYEVNNGFKPGVSKPSSFSSSTNRPQYGSGNNKRPSNTNEPHENPYNKPSNNNPGPVNNERLNSSGSRPNYESNKWNSDENNKQVWGSTKVRTTTSRYEHTSQNSWNKQKRMSQIKCEEYNKIVSDKVRPLPLLPLTSIDSVPSQSCNVRPVELIVGGTDTDIGEFPHMAAIGFRSGVSISWNCGGTLISDQYVLTAAHCTYSIDGQPVKVRLGDWNLKTSDDIQSEEYRIDKIVVHPQYSRSKHYNDVALLKLDSRVQFKKTIRPACLFDKNQIPVNKATATGWGRTETVGAKSNILKKVELPIVPNNECNRMYSDLRSVDSLNQGISSSMVCAGERKGGLDTCTGDSGGPLQFSSKENRCIYYIIGITSFGRTICAEPQSPGVFTRISSFLPWIESVVWP